MKNLNNLTVVITGASSGMGLAAAHAFARRGANVVLAARRRSLLDIAVRECDSLGGRALAVTADVTDPARMRDLVRAAEREFGRIDVWINNAGMSLWGPFEDIPLASQARLVEVNLLSAINGTFAVLPRAWLRRRPGWSPTSRTTSPRSRTTANAGTMARSSRPPSPTSTSLSAGASPKSSKCSGQRKALIGSCRPEPAPSTARCATCSPPGIRAMPANDGQPLPLAAVV
jgi:NAD(P)-dependent dehydrogenase (short-subunit alcohol dehydrogenase family)